jgi:hypothetical protein
MEKFFNFLKIHFDNIILKGKAFKDIANDIVTNRKYQKIMKFNEDRYIQNNNILPIFFVLKENFKKLYNQENIKKTLAKMLLVIRFLKLEISHSKISSIIYN